MPANGMNLQAFERFIFSSARDENFRRPDCASRRGPRILDLGMKTGMPKDARHDRPFGNPHAEQRNWRACQRRLDEQRIGDQFGMWGQHCRTLMASPAPAGEDMIQFLRQVAQLFRREVGGRQAGFLISIDIVRKAFVGRARAERDMGLTVPNENDTHGDEIGGGQTESFRR